jgi:tetratricopeptide (TPR) repeat protein
LPANLVFIYPRRQIDPSNWLSFMPLAILIALFSLFWRYRQSWGRPLLFALSYYILMLLPVLGFFSIYFMKYSLVADHYQYVSIAGMIALVISAGCFLAARLGRWGNIVAKTAGVVILALLATLTWRQCRIYKDEKTLWSDVLLKNPNSWMAHNELGVILQSEGRLDEAMAHYRCVLQFGPNNVEVYNNIGNVFQLQGKTDEAVDYYLKALQVNPNCFAAYYNAGTLFQQQGKTDSAIDYFRQAVRLKPDFAEAHYSLGIVLSEQNKFDQAADHFRKVIYLRPDDADAYCRLGVALQAQGKFDEAISCHRRALKLKPDFAEAYNNIGIALAAEGKLDEAIGYFQQALKVRPDYPKARQNLINTMKQREQFIKKNTPEKTASK